MRDKPMLAWKPQQGKKNRKRTGKLMKDRVPTGNSTTIENKRRRDSFRWRYEDTRFIQFHLGKEGRNRSKTLVGRERAQNSGERELSCRREHIG